MVAREGESDKVQLSDDLTPEQLERLRAAVRLVVNYLLDCQNEIKTNEECCQATVPQVVQLRLEF